MKLITPSIMKEWEGNIFSQYGIPSFLFMEQAGASLFRFIKDKVKLDYTKKIAVISGKGNNGGDGIVCARYLMEAGYDVTLFALFEGMPKGEDAKLNFEFYKKSGGRVYHISEDLISEFKERIKIYSFIVDAILGIGVKREVDGLYKEIIQIVNKMEVPVLSVDTPSGVDLSNGKVLGSAIKATYTITFGIPKIGLYVYPGRYFAGEVFVEKVGFPSKDIQKFKTDDLLIDENMVLSIFPKRIPWGHKGTFGKVLTISGSKGLTGAAYLASMGVLKAGGGLSYLVIPESLDGQIKSMTPEIITIPVEEKDGHIAYNAYDDIMKKIDDVDAFVIGPGLGISEGVKRLVYAIISDSNKPFVLDADGINAISHNPEVLNDVKVPFVITPHPGELGRILDLPAHKVDEDRVDIAKEVSKKYKNMVLVLKGATTIVAKDGISYYNITGNSGMATAGSGDVLSGIIGAFLGRGIGVVESSILGVYVHGKSGDMAASYKGESGIIATDLLAYLPYVLKTIEEEKNDRF